MFRHFREYHRPYTFAALLLILTAAIFATFGQKIPGWGSIFRIAAGDNASRPQYVSGTATIQSIGLEVLNQGDDDQDAVFSLEYKRSADSTWKPAYAPQRSYNRTVAGVTNTYYYASLMFLQPSTSYDFRVTVSDPDGGTGSVINGSAATRAENNSQNILRTLYVSPSGNDSNAGTDPGAPLRTIQRAANISLPGDRILVQAGTYYENIQITRSGTVSNPIVFESVQMAINPGTSPAVLEGGESALAIIDSNQNWFADDHNPPEANVFYTTLSAWSAADNPIYVAAGTEKIYAYWYYPYDSGLQTFSNFVNGLYCSVNCAPGNCCASNVPGGYWYDNSNRRLYLRLPASGQPDNLAMHVVKRNSSGFNINGASNIVIRGFEVRYHHSGVSIRGGALGSTGNIIEKNKLHHNGIGVGLGGLSANATGVYGNLIQDNQIYDSKVSEWPWESVKLNDVESDGINIGAGRANIIRRNTVNDVFNGIMMGIFWDENNENYNKETDVSGNLLYDIGDDAIEPEGAAVNVRIFNNQIYRSARSIAAQAGISVAPVTKGPVWIVRNILSDIKQTAFKFSVGNSVPVGPVFIFHNTVYNSLADFMALLRFWLPVPGIKATLRNNIFFAAGTEGPGSGYGYLLEDIITSHGASNITLDLDYNNWFSSRSSDCGLDCRFMVWINTAYSSLASFLAVSGNESHGLSSNPQFSAPTSNNFNLNSGSPLVDQGLVLGGINDNFYGNRPDMGAIESSFTSCLENWSCSAWSSCINGSQSRTCTDSNSCGTTINRPSLSQSCTCTPIWQCSTWSSCINNNQSRTCTDSNNCGSTSGQPALTQSCVTNPNCTPNWTCTIWSACTNSQQSRTCTDSNNCGSSSGQPPLNQGCSATTPPPNPNCNPNWSCSNWSACTNGQLTRTCNDANNCGVTTGQPPLNQSCSINTLPGPADTGKLFALQDRSAATVYYIGTDGKKYVYPDAKTYFSWYADFNKVQRVSAAKLDSYPDGGVIPYRSSARLITHPNTSKVYAVEPGGVLRHIASESAARNLFGSDWTKRVQDVITGFFSVSYRIGDPLGSTWPSGSLIKYNQDYFYLIGKTKRKFANISVIRINNLFPSEAWIATNLDGYTDGYPVIALEKALATFNPQINENELLGKDPASLGDMSDGDQDGLSYYEETFVWKTNPQSADSDGDGYNDGTELKNGFNPLGSGTIDNWLKR